MPRYSLLIVGVVFCGGFIVSSDIPLTTAAIGVNLPTTLNAGTHTLTPDCPHFSDHTRMLLRCMPTILADICKKNMDHEIARQLLICMEPGRSAQETIQKLGLMRLMSSKDAAHTEYEDVLRRVLHWYTGSLAAGRKAQRAEAECISPKTRARLADELCDSVFFGKQPPKHPYNAIEERNNWLSITQYFPEWWPDPGFTQIFVSLMKNHWKDGTELGRTARNVIEAAYVLSNSDKGRVIFEISLFISPDLSKQLLRETMYYSMRYIIRENGSAYSREMWNKRGSLWMEHIVEALVKEGRSKIIPEIEMPELFQRGAYFNRFFDIQGSRVHSHGYEKKLSDHLKFIEDSGEPFRQIYSARDKQGAKVHLLFDEYIAVGTGPVVERIAFVATIPSKHCFMVQGLGKHTSETLFQFESEPDKLIPHNITAVAYGEGRSWKLKPGFIEMDLVFGCADGNVVFMNYSELLEKVKNPSCIEREVFRVANGPIHCIERGGVRGRWIFACDDALILWRKKTGEKRVYLIPEAAQNRCTIEAVRNYDCSIVYKLSNGKYGTLIPFTQDECHDILMSGNTQKRWDLRDELDKKYEYR